MHEPLDLGSYTASASASSAVKEEDLEKDLQPKETHYLNANCVLLTYFTGDTSTVVDEHFTRALNQPSSFGSETHAPKNLISKGKLHSLLWTGCSHSHAAIRNIDQVCLLLVWFVIGVLAILMDIFMPSKTLASLNHINNVSCVLSLTDIPNGKV